MCLKVGQNRLDPRDWDVLFDQGECVHRCTHAPARFDNMFNSVLFCPTIATCVDFSNHVGGYFCARACVFALLQPARLLGISSGPMYFGWVLSAFGFKRVCVCSIYPRVQSLFPTEGNVFNVSKKIYNATKMEIQKRIERKSESRAQKMQLSGGQRGIERSEYLRGRFTANPKPAGWSSPWSTSISRRATAHSC